VTVFSGARTGANDSVMNAPMVVEGRLAASRTRVLVLSEAFDAWLDHRRKADTFEQYASQIDTIEGVIRKSVDAVTGTIPKGSEDLAAAYETCRLADRRTVWVERVWRFFASRFDQRDGEPATVACIRAADEVLWSCWRPCFSTGPTDARPTVPGPVPLPYLDAVHAPEAFPATLVPADLAATYADAPFVREHLTRLPVPTVRVPAAADHEPWLLGLVAHEVGHHIQFAAGLVEPFRNAVEAAVHAMRADKDAVERWTGWSAEVFADLASVAMLGPWALWPIAELELRDPGRMVEPRGAYPPGLVRLRLLAAAVAAVGLDPSEAWPTGDLTADTHAEELPDLAFVDAVVEAGLTVGPPGFTLAEWIDLRTDDFEPAGEIDQWRRWFGGGPVPNTVASLRAPRTVVAGAVAASADARRAAAARREQVLGNVRDNAYKCILALRAVGRRAADDAVPVIADLDALAAAIAQAGEAELIEEGLRV
jgi:hypothetical protein